LVITIGDHSDIMAVDRNGQAIPRNRHVGVMATAFRNEGDVTHDRKCCSEVGGRHLGHKAAVVLLEHNGT